MRYRDFMVSKKETATLESRAAAREKIQRQMEAFGEEKIDHIEIGVSGINLNTTTYRMRLEQDQQRKKLQRLKK